MATKAPARGTGFHAKIGTIKFKGRQFRTSMQVGCRKVVREAAKAWLIAVTRRIPVRTGFLVGAFGNLEDALNLKLPNQGTGPMTQLNTKKGMMTKKLKDLTNSRLNLLANISLTERKIRRLEFAQTKFRGPTTPEQESGTGRRVKESEIKHANIEGMNKNLIRRTEEQNAKYQKRIDVLRKRLEKLYTRRNKVNERSKRVKGITEYSKGIYDVAAELHEIRKEMQHQGMLKREYNPRIGYKGKVLRRREYVEVQREVEHQAKVENLSNKEKLARLRAGIRAKKEEIGKQKVTEIRERLKIFGGGTKNIYGHKEFYKHIDGRRVLKTPRSGRQFATPEEQIFLEYVPDNIISRLEQQREAASRFQSGAFEKNVTSAQVGGKQTSILPNIYNDAIADNYIKEMQRTETRFTFQYVVAIRYYSYNDMFRSSGTKKGVQSVFDLASTKMPWMSQIAGAQAFKRFMETQAIRSLPNVFEFFLTRTQKFDGKDAVKSMSIVAE